MESTFSAFNWYKFKGKHQKRRKSLKHGWRDNLPVSSYVDTQDWECFYKLVKDNFITGERLKKLWVLISQRQKDTWILFRLRNYYLVK